MTYDELRTAIGLGTVIECKNETQKRDVICMMYEMGFTLTTMAKKIMEHQSYPDMCFPYVGLNRYHYIDGYNENGVLDRGLHVIHADVALAVEDTLFELDDVMSLFLIKE